MCLEVGQCCFCVDLSTATRAIALMEAAVSAPMVVQGVAALSVGHLSAGLLLFVSAWVLFDGALLRRRGLLAGWLVATAAKAGALLSAGVVCAFLVNDVNSKGDPARSTGVLDALNSVGESYLSCCVFSFTEHKTLFYVVYSVVFFVCGFGYMYCFSVVYSYRKDIPKNEEGGGKMKKRRSLDLILPELARSSSKRKSRRSSGRSRLRHEHRDRSPSQSPPPRPKRMSSKHKRPSRREEQQSEVLSYGGVGLPPPLPPAPLMPPAVEPTNASAVYI